MSPAAGYPMGYLLDACFTPGNNFPTGIQTQFTMLISQRDTSFSKIFLRKDVRSHLTPEIWNFHVMHLEDNRSVRISDDGRALLVGKHIKRALPCSSKF